MGTTMNRALSQFARNSALSKCTTPLFLCDMNLHLCMFTEQLNSLYAPLCTTGKSMIGILPADLPEQLQQAPDGILFIPVTLPNFSSHIIALHSEAGDEPCIVCILQVFDQTLLGRSSKYLRPACLQITSTVYSLLNTVCADTDKLSFACLQLTRLLSISRFTAIEESEMSIPPQSYTELVPYIHTALAAFKPKFASVGGSLSIISNKASVFFCACQPMCLGAVLVPMITAAFCRSADGKVQLAVDSVGSLASTAVISVIAPHPTASIGNLDDLIGGLHMLQLDLIAAKDIADHAGIALDCSTEDGRLIIRMTVAHTRPGVVAFHAPNQSADTVFLSNLIAQLFALGLAEKE